MEVDHILGLFLEYLLNTLTMDLCLIYKLHHLLALLELQLYLYLYFLIYLINQYTLSLAELDYFLLMANPYYKL
ncbi:hypothetical protein SDC9_89064 [bioreactor metagenome]|uniref:Uncharacterized protein n=1 Tax=bioreactor metagenome TaxID=1076179 RepID=A0A644ZN74_9ZZZZ